MLETARAGGDLGVLEAERVEGSERPRIMPKIGQDVREPEMRQRIARIERQRLLEPSLRGGHLLAGHRPQLLGDLGTRPLL